jgi:hypothetical protein
MFLEQTETGADSATKQVIRPWKALARDCETEKEKSALCPDR